VEQTFGTEFCVCRRAASALLVVASICTASIQELYAQTLQPGNEVHFDIPAQPLAVALQAYGKATGLDIFYDGALSVGRRSTALSGAYKPSLGLAVLLRDTGYVVRDTDIPNTISIVAAPPAVVRDRFERYQPYFAILQARLSAALCGDAASPEADEITLRFWLNSSGVISNAELLHSSGSEDWRRRIVARMQGLWIGKSPPGGLPEPLTMVIYPPSVTDATSCFSSDGRHAGN
jgi:hypothetical protein